jgi:hypothetical protein
MCYHQVSNFRWDVTMGQTRLEAISQAEVAITNYQKQINSLKNTQNHVNSRYLQLQNLQDQYSQQLSLSLITELSSKILENAEKKSGLSVLITNNQKRTELKKSLQIQIEQIANNLDFTNSQLLLSKLTGQFEIEQESYKALEIAVKRFESNKDFALVLQSTKNNSGITKALNWSLGNWSPLAKATQNACKTLNCDNADQLLREYELAKTSCIELKNASIETTKKITNIDNLVKQHNSLFQEINDFDEVTVTMLRAVLIEHLKNSDQIWTISLDETKLHANILNIQTKLDILQRQLDKLDEENMLRESETNSILKAISNWKKLKTTNLSGNYTPQLVNSVSARSYVADRYASAYSNMALGRNFIYVGVDNYDQILEQEATVESEIEDIDTDSFMDDFVAQLQDSDTSSVLTDFDWKSEPDSTQSFFEFLNDEDSQDTVVEIDNTQNDFIYDNDDNSSSVSSDSSDFDSD